MGQVEPREISQLAEFERAASLSSLAARYAHESPSSETHESPASADYLPPLFAEEDTCGVCSRSFGMSLWRHHCRGCGASVCDAHSKRLREVIRVREAFRVRARVRVLSRRAAHTREVWRYVYERYERVVEGPSRHFWWVDAR